MCVRSVICTALKRAQFLHIFTSSPAFLKMGCRRTDCISKPLSGLFEKLGSLVGSSPLSFFVIPLILTAVLGGGFTFLRDREDNDFEGQYTPKKGPSKVTRAFVKENFPYNESMFSEERLYNMGHYASLIALSPQGSNILENPAFEDVLRLNDKILNITVNGTLGYKDLCAKVYGECVSNTILEIVQSNETQITYPVYTYRSISVFLGSVLGGVITGADSSVVSARTVKLFYYLDNLESTADASKLWLRGFKKLLSDETDGRHIDVSITLLEAALCFLTFLLLAFLRIGKVFPGIFCPYARWDV